MHRVELKVIPLPINKFAKLFVPNAPCGVESGEKDLKNSGKNKFLMHRVELKDIPHR